jgi:hypothetical protein
VLLKDMEAPAQKHLQYRQRWHWGLHHYYLRHYRAGSAEPIDE